MDQKPVEVAEQIKAFYGDQNLQEHHKRFKGDDEFKRIGKLRKNKRVQELNTDNPTELAQKLRELIHDIAKLHRDVYVNTKKLANAAAEKEKTTQQNEKLKKQVKILDSLRSNLTTQIQEKKDVLQQTIENEKREKQEVVQGFQKEIEDIQEKWKKASETKQRSEAENGLYKEKMKEIYQHKEKSDSVYQAELDKLKEQREDKQNKIQEQIEQIAQSLGRPQNNEEQEQRIKDEMELVDKHLTPYVMKSEEFTSLIDKTNGQFSYYQVEMDKLQKQNKLYELQAQEAYKKCEKTDIYMVQQVKEHLTLKQELAKKKEQLETLNNLLKSLQSQK